jgi:hypothetical protein
MTALGFLSSGGMANIGGDIPEPERQPLQDIAKAFGEAVRRLALAKGLPASKQAVWNAQWFFGAVDIYKRIADLKEKLEQRLNSTVGKAV